MNKYIGVDLGTSSSKFLLVDIEGNVDKQCSRSYPVFYPQDGWSEQDPSLWIEALISGVKELTSNEDINEIKGKEMGEVSALRLSFKRFKITISSLLISPFILPLLFLFVREIG